jgi:flavin reductase (DIM6/NTAB) family NADH-FMN oxidoreductase RutF
MTSKAETTRLGREITDIDRAFDVQIRGVEVITTRLGDRINGMTAAWVSRASEQPFLTMISVYKENFSHGLISQSRIFAVNFLADGQQSLAIHFGRQSGREVDKFRKVDYFQDRTGSPILSASLAFLDCRVVAELDSGDHTIFLGEVLSGRVMAKGPALLYRLTDYTQAVASPEGPLED